MSFDGIGRLIDGELTILTFLASVATSGIVMKLGLGGRGTCWVPNGRIVGGVTIRSGNSGARGMQFPPVGFLTIWIIGDWALDVILGVNSFGG